MSLYLQMQRENLKFIVFFFCFVWATIFAQDIPKHPFLDDGISAWHRFSVEETGVQKIDVKFLQDLGIPVQDINPKTLRVFGRGGEMLPLQLSDDIETLHENFIWVVGEEDGSFDSEDYILFMGYAGDTWNAESETFKNLYNDSSAYYITFGSTFGKRIMPIDGQAAALTNAKNYGIFQVAQEEDRYSLGAIGRRWFGLRFSDEQTETLTLQTPNVAEGATIDLAVRLAAVSNISSSFSLTAENNTVNASLGKTSNTIVATEPNTRFNSIRGIVSMELEPTSEVNATLTYDSNGDFSSNGYLDYVLVQYNRKLLGNGGSFLFTLDASMGLQQLTVSDTTPQTSLWELGSGVVHLNPEGVTSFGAEVLVDETDTFYLATDYKAPTFNRNSRKFTPYNVWEKLEALPPTTYLLITSEEFRKEGERLVAHRRQHLGLQAQLLTLEEIYEAFSCGQQDIAAIRNAIRYLYFTQGKKLKYLCLFGDTSVDYKDRLASNDMVVPTFHALPSFSLANTYMSDDFFTMMDAGEGLLSSTDVMDMATGRMVFSNETQSRVVVDKVIAYESAENKGSWNNVFTLLSDDADKTNEKDDYKIQVELDKVGDELLSQKPFLNITKLHADAFKQVASAGGDRYPDVERALENRLSQGALVVNYFGHGGEDGLASEFLVDKDMASTLFHPGKYPLFITSTCEFAKFDNPDRQTAGELIYQNPTGGAIGLITTTRQIYVSNGIDYNAIISKYLFSFGSEEYTSVAEALRRAKNEFRDTSQKRIVFYLGDPALKLNIPKREVKITHMNEVAIEDLSDAQRQLKALDTVVLKGGVYNYDGVQNAEFDGTVTVQVFDKAVTRSTLGNDGNKIMEFSALGKQIFQGLASVRNGQFSASFVVPKDISLDVGEARISLIAFNEDKSESLGGYSDKLTIGGLNSNVTENTQGPAISVYLNDRTFVDGDRVFDSPTLLVDLSDQNGINTAGGIGHDITAVLDENLISPYVLNAYYTTALDDFTKGTLEFPLNGLATGIHTLSVKAWDTHNNPNTQTITFWVMDNDSILLENIFNTPNPVLDQTTFVVKHNRPRELLEAKIYIFAIDGKRIWHTSQSVFSNGYFIDSLTWDTRSYSGQPVNKGTYVYTIELISALSGSSDTISGKLIIN